MIRLLIVDDEPFIVNGLADRCEQAEHLELEVYRAYTPSEALSWLERIKIDIVLSDIKMPGMSGLELQRRIVRQWPRCKLIFLTGYDDFAYIQEATRSGSVDYILKTEGNDKVLASLERAIGLLQDELEVHDLIARAQQQLEAALPQLQRQYVLELLRSGGASAAAVRRQFAELNIGFHAEEPCLVLLCRVDDWHDRSASADRSLFLYAMQNIVEEFLRPGALTMAVEYDRSRLVWLIQHPLAAEQEPTEEQRRRTLRFVHGTLEQIQSACRELLQLRVSFAAAREWTPWAGIAARFEALRQLFSSGLGIGKETLLIEPPPQPGEREMEQPQPGASLLRPRTLELLRSALDHGEREAFMTQLTETLQAAPSEGPASLLGRMELYYALVVLYLPCFGRLQREGQSADETTDLSRLTRLEDHGSWEEACAYLIAVAERIFAGQEQGRSDQEHAIVVKVRRYIHEHLSGDLSLTQLGEAVGHNPSYLSRLYKQATGEGLSETITAARLAEAKRLLTETTARIHEVAASVGFVSPPYFYRFFKKATDLTPQEYRDRMNS